MRNSITWYDRLRSRITGEPAEVYVTRRLARQDLHALEEQRARAVERLTEDIELIDRYVNPLERYMDGDRLLAPLGTILDRRSGKNLPLVWTELDLREFRRWARVICDVNPFAVGFLGLLVDFHIRQGFGWQTVWSSGHSSSVTRHSSFENTTEVDVSGFYRMTEDEGPRTVSECQAVLDEWRDESRWDIKSREAFRRWRRDGEVFLRFFRGGPETRGLPVIRFVEPEQVGPPPGDDADGRWSFGIHTDPEDIEDVQAYFVRDPQGTGSEGDEVPADRILHLKANVDSSIKRGLPDFLPVQDDLERVRRMLRNMGEVAAVQTAIAWVSQYATATPEQVGTLIRAGSDYTRPKLGDPSGKLIDVVNYEPGTVLHMDSNRQFLAGPVGSGTPGFIQVEQAILRGCGARWRFPEYFSGDASNNNMASSIVAGSPFVVAVEGNQLEWGVFERAVAKKVLELCVQSGRLLPEQVAAVDVKVTPPTVALANREEEEKLRQMRNQAGVLSVTTWQQQVGLDPKHEAANLEMEARRSGQQANGRSTDKGYGSRVKKESASVLLEEDLATEEWYLTPDYLLLDEAVRKNLKPKKVQVTRDGETFTTTVYVNPNKKSAGGKSDGLRGAKSSERILLKRKRIARLVKRLRSAGKGSRKLTRLRDQITSQKRALQGLIKGGPKGVVPKGVKPVNGRLPINWEYAGKTYLKALPSKLKKKYPKGVRFDSHGFPDFSPYSPETVAITFTGSRSSDFKAANKAAGYKSTPEGYTWHHHQDVGNDGAGKMVLVPSDLHKKIKHTGGVARWEEMFPDKGFYSKSSKKHRGGR